VNTPFELSSHLPLNLRSQFVMQLAKRLHEYGTSAHRLEGAVGSVAKRLHMNAHVLSTPTSLILSLHDLSEGADRLLIPTQVIRLNPGEINLSKLSHVDAIAEEVLAGTLDLEQGYHQLEALTDAPSSIKRALTLLAFGLASGAVAVLLKTSLLDVGVAFLLGVIIGLVAWLSERSRRMAGSFEAVSALLATMAAYAIESQLPHLAAKQVIMASLIVLLPGLSLTIAITELSTQHLMSGTARFAGAMTSLLKLAFGFFLGTELVKLLGLYAPGQVVNALPPWAVWAALPFAAFSFAVLFKARVRDFPLVMLAVIYGYAATRLGSEIFNPDFGVFIAGLLVAAASNLYASWSNRPGALVRVPGIILLVPGSVGYRSLSFLMEKNVESGLETGFALMIALISLVAGMLFGNLLVPPRHHL
jgi:uncharacterized membrane protein YjjP (DUF1212 family)